VLTDDERSYGYRRITAMLRRQGVVINHKTVQRLMAADAQARRVIFVTGGRDAKTIEALAADLLAHGCPPEQITSVSIDMSPAFIKGVSSELPNAQLTFDKFHVVAHANAAVDKTRRIEQRTDKSLKGMR